MGEREERFDRLFHASYPALWRYTRRRVPEADVDDVLAETFTVAWRRLDDVPECDAALPWLYRVAANTIANRRRSQRRHVRLVARLQAERPPAEADGLTQVLEALAALRPEDQEALRLAAWEGLTAAEIAVVLGCSANAAALRP